MTEKVIKKFNINGLTVPIDDSKIKELEMKVIKIEGIGTMSNVSTTGITGDNQYFISSYNGKLYRSYDYDETNDSFSYVEVPYEDGMILVYSDEIMLGVNGNRVDVISELKNADKLLSYKIIKLVGFGTISMGNTGVTGSDQYFYSTYNHKIYQSKDYKSPTEFVINEVPYVDGSLYMYNNEIYEWNGQELIKITHKDVKITVDTFNILNNLIIGFKYMVFQDGVFIKLSDGVGSIIDMNPTNGNTFRCGVIDVSEGEKYIITTTGGAVGRAYGFVDANNTLIEVAESMKVLNNAQITVPSNAVKLIVNCNIQEICYAYRANIFTKLEDEIYSVQNEINDIKHYNNYFTKDMYTQAYIDDCKMVWNPNQTASYNTLCALTDKILSMMCEVIYTEPDGDENKFTTVALISNPNGIYNTKQFWEDLNNKPKTHINIKSIHPVFTRNYCNFGIMYNGELFNIPYNGDSSIRYIDMQPNVKYKYGYTITDNGVNILLPDGNIVTLNNGEYNFISNKNGVSTSITLNIDFNDYCGRYCCYEFFNNSSDEIRKRCGQPQFTKVQITQSDGYNIYDNFIRPNGLLGITPAGFIWSEQAHEGYYGYQNIIS